MLTLGVWKTEIPKDYYLLGTAPTLLSQYLISVLRAEVRERLPGQLYSYPFLSKLAYILWQ